MPINGVNNNIPSTTTTPSTNTTNTATTKPFTTIMTAEAEKKKAEEEAAKKAAEELAKQNTLTDAEKAIGITIDPNTGKKIYPKIESLEALQKRSEELEKLKNKRKDPYSKDTFLQLLVAQMKHQDPLEPMNNEQMLSQMAQFSTVEQITNLNKSFDNFAKDFSSTDKDGNKINVLVEQLKQLNENIDKISSNFGVTKDKDGKITTDMDKFLEDRKSVV